MIPGESAASNVTVPEDAQKETIYAGQTIEVGYVYVWVENMDTLYIKYDITKTGWKMTESHMDYGESLSDIPQTKKGNPIPGKFDYKNKHNPAVTEYTYEIDIEGMFDNGDTLYIATHCVVINGNGKGKGGSETGWAGEEEFPGKNWAKYFKFEFPTEEIWPPSGTASFGFEDLPLESEDKNDWDYNDFVVDVSIVADYDGSKIQWIKWTYTAEAKIASYKHVLNMLIKKDVFGSDGEYDVYYYKNGGDDLISSSTGQDYDKDSNFNIDIFSSSHTGDAVEENQVTVVKITFDSGFDFDLEDYEYEDMDAHATGLFFDPWLKVGNNGVKVHTGDIRMVFVPEDWEWTTEDGRSIWLEYPYDSTEGIGVKYDTINEKPVFIGDWYTL